MEQYAIRILDQDGQEKAGIAGENQAILAWEGEYAPGDRIQLLVPETPQYYVLRVDEVLDEAFVYLTEEKLEYLIPFDEKKDNICPKAFGGERHYLTLRKAEDYEISSYKNLAKNTADQHEDKGCYPHAYANVETRGESVFAARNAIDGVVSNLSHGKWPYASWGINQQDDAEMTLDFGRPVDFDKIVLYTRADFPHDNWWVQVTFTFSDGSCETVNLEKSIAPHVIPVRKSGITWLKFGNLIKADDPSPFPALTQIEVYGTESGIH